MTTQPRTEQRVAIVTGGSRGIGRQIAQQLAADGFAVVVGYAGNKDAADQAVRAIEEAGGTAYAARADVADETAVAALFDQAEATYGGVDAVVHAAGRMPLSPIAELDLAELDALYRTNIRGTFVVDQQAARRLRPGGALVNLSSSVVGLAFPGYGAYAASKGAVEAVTLILARELRGRDVTVNAVAPGPTATDLFLDGKDEETVARLAAQPRWSGWGPPGHRFRGVVPGRPDRSLGQRAGAAGQRRHHLTCVLRHPAPPRPSPLPAPVVRPSAYDLRMRPHFTGTSLITHDVPALAAFYARVLDAEVEGEAPFARVTVPGAVLSFFSTRGAWSRWCPVRRPPPRAGVSPWSSGSPTWTHATNGSRPRASRSSSRRPPSRGAAGRCGCGTRTATS